MRDTPPTRRPTVSPPTWRSRIARHHSYRETRTRSSGPILSWLKRESIALLALSGAALTVLSQLAKSMPLAPQLSLVLTQWQDWTNLAWRPPLDLLGAEIHPDIVAALNVSVFMVLLGLGARISARLGGQPLPPLRFNRFFDDQTWPSLLVFAALCMTFLVGHDTSDRTGALTVMGSEEIGKYAFAGLVTVGYFAGDLIGHRPFHLRLYRLVAIVAVLVAVNFAILHFSASGVQ